MWAGLGKVTGRNKGPCVQMKRGWEKRSKDMIERKTEKKTKNAKHKNTNKYKGKLCKRTVKGAGRGKE